MSIFRCLQCRDRGKHLKLRGSCWYVGICFACIDDDELRAAASGTRHMTLMPAASLALLGRVEAAAP